MWIDRRTVLAGLVATMGVAHATPRTVRAQRLRPLEEHERVLLRIGGDDVASTTVIPRIAANFLSLRGAGDIEIHHAEPPWTTRVRGRLLPDSLVSILIRSTSTVDGFDWLAAGQTDLWLSARPASDDEEKTLARLGELAFARVGRFGLVVAVHQDNPVSALSHDQLRDIYSGRVVDWAEVGGAPGPIRVYGRTTGSASEGAFADFFYGEDGSADVVRALPLFADMQRAIADNPRSIGYVAVGYDKGLKRVALTVDGRVPAHPDVDGLETEDYPLTNNLFLYRLERPGMDDAEAFVREALSARTEYMMSRYGLRTAGPRLIWPKTHPLLPAGRGIAELTANAVRVNITIHFKGDSDDLDSAALQDIRDLVRYLRHLSVPTRELVHPCYSDDSGDPARDEETSKRLGKIFAAALEEENFVAGQIVPLGATARLASDATLAGRRANRRVETWIRP